MKFYELIQRADWEDVKNSIAHCYPKYAEDTNGFLKVFYELKELSPEPNKEELTIVIKKQKDEFSDYEEYQVSGYSKNDDTLYGLDFSKWESWLGYEVSLHTLEELSESDIIAHCLWEMTFYGFDNDAIQEQADELLKQSKAIENKEYVTIQEICPFCEGTKKDEVGTACSLCDEQGTISVLYFHDETLN